MPSRRAFISTIGLAAAAAGSAIAVTKLINRERPNLIFIMLDDLGKEWVGCYGSAERLTTNADQLAEEGMKFQNVYAMPACVLTRATLLTGQYPSHHGWTMNWNVPFYGIGHFDPDVYFPIARVLKTAGYVTAAAGKWQINDFRVQPDVLEQLGFDSYCMWTGIERDNIQLSEQRYWSPYIHTKNGSKAHKAQFGEDVFSRFVINFMRKNRELPMMVYYPMCLPHLPLVATPLDSLASTERDLQRAMIRYADHKLGQIIGALEELKIRDRTIVIWTSDNGSPVGSSAVLDGRPVAGGKGTLRESGINVPFVVSAPGMVPAGVTSDALIDFTDLLPTFAELAGSELADNAARDGRSFARHVLGRERDGPRQWIMSMAQTKASLSPDGRLTSASSYAERVVRDKRYKLWIGEDRRSWKLADLGADPAEANNLLDSREPEHRQARARLEGVVDELFSKPDASPRYGPLNPGPWALPADEAVRRFNRTDRQG